MTDYDIVILGMGQLGHPNVLCMKHFLVMFSVCNVNNVIDCVQVVAEGWERISIEAMIDYILVWLIFLGILYGKLAL